MLKPIQCQPCKLYSISNGFSLPEGNCSNGVLMLGEGLGHHEMMDGLPFRPQGQSGSLLEYTAFRLARTSRSQFLIDNVCRCQPPGDDLNGAWYEHAALSHCHNMYGSRVFDDSRVKVILALGAIPFREVTGLAGKKLGISECRGYVHFSSRFRNIPVVGSYHPAHIRRGKLAYTDYLVHDMRKAIAVANGSYRQYCRQEKYPHKYILYPSEQDALSYFYQMKDAPLLNLAYDIETPNSAEAEEDERDDITTNEITSIQFSHKKGHGIYMPWQGNYIKVAKALLRLANRKLCFNGWNFDNPKLYANQAEIRGQIIDLMWKFHHLKPDLEMGLQKVASICDFPFIWKHYASDERMQRFYGCVDVDVLHYVEPKVDSILRSMVVPDFREECYT